MKFKVLWIVGLVLAAAAGQAKAAFVVDYSPDTTTAGVFQSSWTNSFNNQIIGDKFTLSTNTTLTGGAIFSNSDYGAVADSARFMVFADVGGVAAANPLLDITVAVDAVDAAYTASQSILTRKHVTIAPTFLAAGSYWFAMPGNGTEFAQASGFFDDGAFRFGNTNLQNFADGLGDMFFQLEGNSAAVPEPASIAMWGLGAIGMVFASRKRRQMKLAA